MFMISALRSTGSDDDARTGERGSGIVEWLGISALSIGMLVGLFAALEQVGASIIDSIRASLGV